MIKKSINTFSLAAILMLVMAPSVYAADGEALFTSKGCNACHGAGGKAPITGAYPKIAGQNLEYIEEQMKDIKSGARNNGQTAVMKGIMAAVSDEEIKAIAEYLSSES